MYTLIYILLGKVSCQFQQSVACIINLLRLLSMTLGVVNKPETSLTDDARVVIYDRHMFIEQAADGSICRKYDL